MYLYKSCYYVGSVVAQEDLFWGFLLSLILKDIESKSFYYVVRDFLPIITQHSPPSNKHKHSPSVSNILRLSAEDRFPTSQKIKK